MCSCEHFVVTTLLMSSIMMKDAQSEEGKAERAEGKEMGVTVIKDHKLMC